MSVIEVSRPDERKLEELGVENWSPWSCDVSTFDWEYDCDETAYLYEGRVKVVTRDGEEVEIKAGDLVKFPKGLKCTWHVLEPVRKVFRFE